MESGGLITVTVEPPRGTFQARVDDKGRLKLPVAIQHYLIRLGENPVFVTSLDGRQGRIYPISIWKKNEEFFASGNADPTLIANVQTMANHYGADSDVDNQGRVLVPTVLRRDLGLENQPVFLECQRGRINFCNQKDYEERLAQAKQNAAANAAELEKLGMR